LNTTPYFLWRFSHHGEPFIPGPVATPDNTDLPAHAQISTATIPGGTS
jgi:hypothetical protein